MIDVLYLWNLKEVTDYPMGLAVLAAACRGVSAVTDGASPRFFGWLTEIPRSPQISTSQSFSDSLACIDDNLTSHSAAVRSPPLSLPPFPYRAPPNHGNQQQQHPTAALFTDQATFILHQPWAQHSPATD